jgi:hypothetical protein
MVQVLRQSQGLLQNLGLLVLRQNLGLLQSLGLLGLQSLVLQSLVPGMVQEPDEVVQSFEYESLH